MGEFFSSWPFIIIMAVLLVVLIGLFIYLRKQRQDED
jgi:LPXTG-motif cell wall-anchored protein